MRTFQFSDAASHKFWNVDVQGSSVVVTFGKIGTKGQTQTKAFATPEKAQAEADKLIREKTKKGYHETTAKATTSEAEAFEAALKENPYDLAGHCAFADFLAERGDPRGEFMQVQIALEDEKLSAAERKKLQKREAALLKKHKGEWVGEWAERDDIRGGYDWSPQYESWVPYRFTRGLLTGVEISELTVDLARELLKAPQLGFVRELIIHGLAYQEEGDYEPGPDTHDLEGHEDVGQHILVRWPQLRHIRVFRFGGDEPIEYETTYSPYRCHTSGDLIAAFAKQMPHIEELRIMAHFGEEANALVALPMPQLRSLLLYHGWRFPLDRLAKNESLTNLRELYCHPHAKEPGDNPYINLPHLKALCKSPHLTSLRHLQLRMADFGDAGIHEIIKSGLLKRLEVLDLRHGLVTDDGAKALTASADLKHLKHLDLRQNRIGPDGVAALKKTGVSVATDAQQSASAQPWDTFGQGDIE